MDVYLIRSAYELISFLTKFFFFLKTIALSSCFNMYLSEVDINTADHLHMYN